MSTTLLGYKGTVIDADDVRTEQAVLAKLMPVGTRVRHAGCGRLGTVAMDEPPHVPGTFDGRPTAWCFTGRGSGEALVCVNWDNNLGFDKWIVWAPLAVIRTLRGARLENRPGMQGPRGDAR